MGTNALPKEVTKILIANAKWETKKPLSRKEAFKTFTADFILKKYPRLKSILMARNPLVKEWSNAQFLAHDLAHWACHDKEWVNA